MVGRKRSRAADNVEGVPESELKRWRTCDNALCRKFKKRRRIDLTAAELDAIVEETKQPFKLQKDVA